jgi:hypothetical protein
MFNPIKIVVTSGRWKFSNDSILPDNGSVLLKLEMKLPRPILKRRKTDTPVGASLTLHMFR